MMPPRWTVALLAATSLAGALGIVACAGQGRARWAEIEPSVGRSCGNCHDATKIDKLIGDLKALDNSKFDDASFPAENFPPALRSKSAQDLVNAREIPEDATIDPNGPKQKAWMLHELHELKGLLGEDPPPDYTSEDSFVKFATAGKPGAWEGCEVGAKLDLGEQKDPEGMVPLWAPKLFELLGTPFTDITAEERLLLRDYTDALLPGGLRACSATGESS